ncbi:Cytochrome b-c1 complex subunit-1, mitochondrial [Sesamum angolense]|uniref:Complex III subunit VI n=1 Tax=Sesamum angolense TaxID=2727404 RepID=A0AAE1WYE2_9LAMI|nr:Cytochrome b-c1 complex subunit-1, mitochondrial [Sesamum angolense]
MLISALRLSGFLGFFCSEGVICKVINEYFSPLDVGYVDLGNGLLRRGLPWNYLEEHFMLADDEPVDPKKELEDRCKAPCTRPLKEYQLTRYTHADTLNISNHTRYLACAKRIQGDESGHKHCTGQYFDYWRCVDKCVATKLFSYLKQNDACPELLGYMKF